jgi:hypothetical protein
LQYIEEHGIEKALLIKHKDGLGLEIPDAQELNLEFICKLVG